MAFQELRNNMGYKSKSPDAPSDSHKPVVKQDKQGGFWFIEDSENELNVGNRNDDNQKAMNRKIEESWPSFDEISKLGSERI